LFKQRGDFKMEKSTNLILSAVLALSLPAAVLAAGLEGEMQKMPPDTTHLYPTPTANPF
jgi:hypothetical protein